MTPSLVPGRRRRADLVLLLLFLAVQSPFFLRRLGRVHGQRQADTFAVAKNLAFESFDPLRPRVDHREDTTGITGMEVPLYQALVAVGLLAVGSPEVAVARAVSLVATAVAWLLLSRVLRRTLGLPPLAAGGALFLIALPYAYAAQVFPDLLALALAALALERFEAWRAGRRTSALAAHACALGLACLVRPYFLGGGLPLLVFAVRDVVRERRLRAGPLVAGAAVLAAVAAWYALWWPHLERTYGLRYFYAGAAPVPLGDARWWWRLGRKVLCQDAIGWIALPLVVAGAAALLRRRREGGATPSLALQALGVPLLTLVALVAIVGDPLVRHSYYLFPWVPAAVVLAALGLDLVRRRAGRAFPAIVAALVAAQVLSSAWRYVEDSEHARWEEALPEVRRRTREDELVVVEGVHGAFHLHPPLRRGWVLAPLRMRDPARIEDALRRGARWALPLREGRYRLLPMEAWLAEVRAGP